MSDIEDMKLMREIIAAGGKRKTTESDDHSRFARLLDLGWLEASGDHDGAVEYASTAKGRAAGSQ